MLLVGETQRTAKFRTQQARALPTRSIEKKGLSVEVVNDEEEFLFDSRMHLFLRMC